jgi:hypothetical protein
MAMSRIHSASALDSMMPAARQVSASAQSDKAFADYLRGKSPSQQAAASGDADDERVRRRTFSFSDLGVLGLHADTGGSATQMNSARNPQDTNSDQAASELDAMTLRDAIGNPFPETVLANASTVSHSPVLDMPSSSIELHLLSENAASLGATLAPSNMDSAEGESETAIAPEQRFSTPDNRATNPVSVTVSGPDEALVVTARVQGEVVTDPKLQRMVETAAAEFDMQIDELRLNGSPGQPASSIGRNAYGYSSR